MDNTNKPHKSLGWILILVIAVIALIVASIVCLGLIFNNIGEILAPGEGDAYPGLWKACVLDAEKKSRTSPERCRTV